MEFSNYHYNTNKFNATSYTFIKQDDTVKVIQYLFRDNNCYIPYKIGKLCFIISLDKLKKIKNLYNIYLLSLLLTEKLNTLTYSNNFNIYGSKNKLWCISSKHVSSGILHKKMFSDNYYCNYGFNNMPINIYDYDSDDEINNYSLDLTNDENIEYYTSVFDEHNLYHASCLYHYQKLEIECIENELHELEKYFSKCKKLTLFSKRIKKFINYNDDIYNKIVLHLL